MGLRIHRTDISRLGSTIYLHTRRRPKTNVGTMAITMSHSGNPEPYERSISSTSERANRENGTNRRTQPPNPYRSQIRPTSLAWPHAASHPLLNAAVYSTTTYSAFELLYGRLASHFLHALEDSPDVTEFALEPPTTRAPRDNRRQEIYHRRHHRPETHGRKTKIPSQMAGISRDYMGTGDNLTAGRPESSSKVQKTSPAGKRWLRAWFNSCRPTAKENINTLPTAALLFCLKC